MKLIFILVLLSNFAYSATNSYKTLGAGSGVALFKDNFYLKSGLGISQVSVDPTQVATPADQGHLVLNGTSLFLKLDNGTSTNWQNISQLDPSMNLLADPSFETTVDEGTCTNCTADRDASQILTTPTNKAYRRVTFSAASGDYIIDKPTSPDWVGLQGIVSCKARTSAEDVEFCSRSNGVNVDCLQVPSDDKWRDFEIPFVFGNTSAGLGVFANQVITDTVLLEDCKIAAESVVTGVAQSERFGKATWTGAANCEWRATVAVSANYYELAADSDCNDPVIEGSIKPPTTKKPAIVLPSGSPAGTYSFRWTGSPRNEANVTAICHFRFTDGTNNTASGRVYSGAGNDSETPNLLGSITYDSALTSDTEIKIEASGNASSIICTNYNDKTWSKQSFEVVYHPPQSQIVRQSQELDVNSANEFNIVLNNGGTWVETSSDFNPIDSFSAQTSSFFTAVFKPNIFTVAPAVRCNTISASGTIAETLVYGISSTGFSMQGYNFSGGGQANSPVFCTIKKQGADFNKSQIVYGQFEQIKSTETSQVLGGGDSSTTALTANVTPIPWAEARDTNNEFNGTQFTAKRDMVVKILGNVRFTAANGSNLYAYINGTRDVGLSEVNVSQIQTTIGGTVFLNEGDVLEIRSNTSATINSIPDLHWVSLLEEPDLVGIIKNLNDNKNVICSTKYLTANFNTSGGVIADFNFSNLTIGKKYQISINNRSTFNNTDTLSISCQPVGSSTVYGIAHIGGVNGLSPNTFVQNQFSATNTSMECYGNSITAGNAILGGQANARDNAWVELCELPDNYVEGSF